jgi:hypothetical protein
MLALALSLGQIAGLDRKGHDEPEKYVVRSVLSSGETTTRSWTECLEDE